LHLQQAKVKAFKTRVRWYAVDTRVVHAQRASHVDHARASILPRASPSAIFNTNTPQPSRPRTQKNLHTARAVRSSEKVAHTLALSVSRTERHPVMRWWGGSLSHLWKRTAPVRTADPPPLAAADYTGCEAKQLDCWAV